MSHTPPLPAYETKNKTILHYPILPTTLVLELKQSDTTQNTTGSTLWLGAQILALYLFDVYGSKPRPLTPTERDGRPKAIDLGAGIGLTAHALAMLGFDVVATDLKVVIDAVLRQNIEVNLGHVKAWGGGTEVGGVATGCGDVKVRELDWLTGPEDWDWDCSSTQSTVPRQKSLPEETQGTRAGDSSPHFDLIVTTDTLYHQDLVAPLLGTIKQISIQSRKGRKYPLVLVALERRDPEVIEYALGLAKNGGFDCKKIPNGKIRKCLDSVEYKWKKEDWEGVEIWKWIFRGE